jgi:hypothetical protein
MTGTCKACELLDVDVEELAGTTPLVAVGRLHRPQTREATKPMPTKKRAHRRKRQGGDLGDLSGGHA